MEKDCDLSFAASLPKVELHAHLNGSISEETIPKLLLMKQKSEPSWNYSKQMEVAIEKGTTRSLDDCFRMFSVIHELSNNEASACLITKDVIEEFAKDNVKYLELRTTPRGVSSTGMTKESYINSVIKAIKEQSENKELDIIVKLLLAIDRRTTIEDAYDTVKLAVEARKKDGKDILVGLDLSGDPNKGDARDFIPVFQEAKRCGLKLALHVAEIQSQNDEIQELLKIPPDRIGHGTFLHPEIGGRQEFVETVQKLKIPIEMCLTSNMKSQTVSKLDNHHFGYWYNKQHLCAISTDDKGVFSTSLSEEYHLAAKTFGLNRVQMWDLSYSCIDYTFADDCTKEYLKDKWKSVKKEMF